MGAHGATKLHADEREQLLGVADTLLFGEPDSEQGGAALDLIARLRRSARWSAQNCAELRQHLCGCGPLPRGGLNEAAAPRPPGTGSVSHAARWTQNSRGLRRVRSRRWGSEFLDLPGAGCAVAVAAVVVTSANPVESLENPARARRAGR